MSQGGGDQSCFNPGYFQFGFATTLELSHSPTQTRTPVATDDQIVSWLLFSGLWFAAEPHTLRDGAIN
jgi:hypothetical protein